MRRLGALREDLSILRGNFLVLLVTWVIFRVAHGLAAPYQSLYIRALGATPTILGLMNAASMAALCLSTIPGSYIADRHGRRRIIIVMTYVLGFSQLFYALAPSWELVLAGMVFAGLAQMYHPALQAITADSLPPKKRGLGYALSDIVPGVFAIASPLAAMLLVGRLGLVLAMRIAYFTIFSAFMMAGTIRLLFLKETFRPTPQKGRGGSLLGFYATSARDLASAVKNSPRPLRALLLAVTLFSAIGMPLGVFVPLFIVDFSGITEVEWGLMASIRLAVGLVAALIIGKMADVFSRKKLLSIGYLAEVGLIAGLPFARGLAQVLTVLLILDVLAYMRSLTFRPLIADLTPRGMRGRIKGALTLLPSVAGALSSPVIGMMYEHIDPRLPFFLAGLFSATSGLLVAGVVREPAVREE